MRIPIVGAAFLAVFVFGQETKVYKMGEGVTSPAVLFKTDPPYSEEARLAKVIATVIVQLVVTPQGKTVDFKILQSAGFGLDEQSIASLKQWRFKPGTKDGAPVNVLANVEINFRNFDPKAGASSLLFDLAAGETRPVLMEGTAPTLPVDSAGQRLEVKLTVSNTGVVETVEQASGSGPWINDAVAKIKRWRFTPALKNAVPVSVKGVYSLVPNVTESPTPAPPESPIAVIHKPEPQATPVPAPKLISPPDNAKFVTYPRRTVCRWEPSPGAASYILEWDYLSNRAWQSDISQTSLDVAATGGEASFDFVGAQSGRWRVCPIGAKGQRGNPSEWRMFVYTR